MAQDSVEARPASNSVEQLRGRSIKGDDDEFHAQFDDPLYAFASQKCSIGLESHLATSLNRGLEHFPKMWMQEGLAVTTQMDPWLVSCQNREELVEKLDWKVFPGVGAPIVLFADRAMDAPEIAALRRLQHHPLK